jgi:hypothetical protein
MLIFPIENTETDRKTGSIILINATFGRRWGAMYVDFSSRIARLGTILAVAVMLWTFGPGSAVGDDPCNCNCDPNCYSGLWPPCDPFPRAPWYFSADGVAMQRVFPGLGPAATLGLSPTSSLALSQKDLATPFESGAQMRIGHNFDGSPYQLEVSYLWLAQSDTTAQVVDPAANLYSPFTNFGAPVNPLFDPSDLVTIHQISQLESGDINLKCILPLPARAPTMMLLFGVRHVGIKEQFDYSSSLAGANPVLVHAHTNNNLWGPQIGAVMDYGRENAWLHFEGKAALCNNSANRDLDANVNGVDANHPRQFTSGTATVADASLAILWRPSSILTARIGYQGMWCDQLALAGRNYVADPTMLTTATAEPAVNTRGTLFYHGPFAGLQLNW